MDIDSGVALLLGCVLLTLAGAVTAILAVDTWTRMTRGERAEGNQLGRLAPVVRIRRAGQSSSTRRPRNFLFSTPVNHAARLLP